MTFTASRPKRALLAGATCLLILGGMIVGHAWPLWTGRVITMKAVPVDPRDLFRGEYVRLNTAATELHRDPAAPSSIAWAVARPLDDVYVASRRGAFVYVQLEPAASGDYVPVSVSRQPVPGAINLRGRDRFRTSGARVTTVLYVDYGLDAFYVQEGRARRVEEAIRQGRDVRIQVAIASSGRARIKNLLIDGAPLGN